MFAETNHVPVWQDHIFLMEEVLMDFLHRIVVVTEA